MPNLLHIHYALTQVQDFREDVMAQSEKTDNDVQATLQSYFSPLEQTVDIFDERIGLVAMSLIDLVRAGNPSLVVRLAKIIEAEERSDQRVLALQEAQESHQHLAAHFKSMQKVAKVARGYKDKFLTCITASVAAKFENTKNNFDDEPESLPEELAWYFDDLATVQSEFSSLFPPKWKIFDTYLEIYHNFMHDFLKTYIDNPDLDAASLLTIILWNSEYNKGLKSLGIKPTTLSPQVLDSREPELLREYSTLIAKKMEEWINRIIADDTNDFLLRTSEPLCEDGKWHLPSVPTMFTMINQQLNVALDSNKGNVVSSVTDECVRLLKHRQQKWSTVLTAEIARHTSATTQQEQEAIPDGIIEYLMAIANDQIRCTEYTQSLCERIAPLLSSKYEEAIRTSLGDAINGFLDLATETLDHIINIIFNDLKPVTKTLFTNSWYTQGSEMETIVTTMRSYTVDLASGLDESLFPAFMDQLSAKLCIAYLSGVWNKNAKFRTNEAATQIHADVKVGFNFMAEHADWNDVRAVWSVLEHFVALICADKEDIGEKYAAFKEAYWDLPMSWVEQVLKCREEGTRGLLEECKKRDGYSQRGQEPTIMARVVKEEGGFWRVG